jgi:hypothetical protein
MRTVNMGLASMRARRLAARMLLKSAFVDMPLGLLRAGPKLATNAQRKVDRLHVAQANTSGGRSHVDIGSATDMAASAQRSV